VRSLVLLSRFPIVERRSHQELPYRIGEADFGVQRGFLHVVIEPKPGFRTHLIGVHLKSKREVTEADQELMRRHEFFALRKVVDETLAAEPGAKILIYGDFNEHRGEAGFINFLGSRSVPETLLYDVYIKDSNGELWTHFWDAMDVYSRMDYLVVSPGLKPYVQSSRSFIYDGKETTVASDHRPMVLQISYLLAKERARGK
jgi:endonuclease/exonuclease/phosphatase family metal-dependent hydrolase